jgi:hypothetical protein
MNVLSEDGVPLAVLRAKRTLKRRRPSTTAQLPERTGLWGIHFRFTGTIGHAFTDKQANRARNLKQKLLLPAGSDFACEEPHRPNRCFG